MQGVTLGPRREPRSDQDLQLKPAHRDLSLRGQSSCDCAKLVALSIQQVHQGTLADPYFLTQAVHRSLRRLSLIACSRRREPIGLKIAPGFYDCGLNRRAHSLAPGLSGADLSRSLGLGRLDAPTCEQGPSPLQTQRDRVRAITRKKLISRLLSPGRDVNAGQTLGRSDPCRGLRCANRSLSSTKNGTRGLGARQGLIQQGQGAIISRRLKRSWLVPNDRHVSGARHLQRALRPRRPRARLGAARKRQVKVAARNFAGRELQLSLTGPFIQCFSMRLASL